MTSDITRSLYETHAEAALGPDPRPSPGTTFTHAIETVDDDRASFLLQTGVIR